jgi:hypothetical protein
MLYAGCGSSGSPSPGPFPDPARAGAARGSLDPALASLMPARPGCLWGDRHRPRHSRPSRSACSAQTLCVFAAMLATRYRQAAAHRQAGDVSTPDLNRPLHPQSAQAEVIGLAALRGGDWRRLHRVVLAFRRFISRRPGSLSNTGAKVRRPRTPDDVSRASPTMTNSAVGE